MLRSHSRLGLGLLQAELRWRSCSGTRKRENSASNGALDVDSWTEQKVTRFGVGRVILVVCQGALHAGGIFLRLTKY